MSVENILQRANAAMAAQDVRTAEILYREALALAPHNIVTLNALALVLCKKKEFVEAVDCFKRVVAQRPGDPALHCNLGTALSMAGSVNDAIACFETALRLDREHAVSLFNLGNLQREQGRYLLAAESYTTALNVNPQLEGVRFNLAALSLQRGNLFLEQDNADAALAQFDDALSVYPDFPHRADVEFAKGNALKALEFFTEALACYDRAIEFKPDFAEARWNRSQTDLVLENYARGWIDFEWRHTLTPPFGSQRPQWRGEPLAGRTILLHAEQGFGDGLQFARYAQTLKNMGAGKVIIECLPELSPLLLSAPGVDQLAVKGDPTPPFDVFTWMMSVPHLLGETFSPNPHGVPYLFADGAAVENWRVRVAPFAGLKVGIIWAGSSWKNQPGAQAVDRRRSLNLRQLLPLRGIKGVTFFNLQKGEPAAQRSDVDFPLVDFTDELANFADTAALVKNLDLVISVDTAMAHLTGAIGQPVWVLSRFDGCWRWLRDRTDSPWYPSARIFRQRDRRDWAPTILEVRRALEELVAGELPLKK